MEDAIQLCRKLGIIDMVYGMSRTPLACPLTPVITIIIIKGAPPGLGSLWQPPYQAIIRLTETVDYFKQARALQGTQKLTFIATKQNLQHETDGERMRALTFNVNILRRNVKIQFLYKEY